MWPRPSPLATIEQAPAAISHAHAAEGISQTESPAHHPVVPETMKGWSNQAPAPKQVEALARIRAARFPAAKSLDTFDFPAIPSLNKVLVMELARCEYIQSRENVIAVGNSGTGKTHVALGWAWPPVRGACR